jgi:vacuolar-type H+-ATPase subunit E/Vma4
MGLEEIIKNIELDTEAREKQINEQAIAESRKIKEDAEGRAEKFLAQAMAKADNEAKQMLMRELSRANIEAKGIYQKAVNDAINKSFQSLFDNLEDFMETSGYAELLRKLAKLAVEELGSDSTIFLQKADIQKLKTTQKEGSIQEAKEEFVGGLRALSKDGKRYVDYSLEKIIESLRERMAVKLLDLVKG